MKTLILAVCVFLVVGTLWAQTPAAVDIARVSATIDMSPGLYIVDAWTTPGLPTTATVHDSETGIVFNVWGLLLPHASSVGLTFVYVDEEFSFAAAAGTNPPHGVQAIVLYSLQSGPSVVVREIDQEISNIWPIGFSNGVLVVGMFGDNIGNAVARIAGWENLGLPIPDETKTADLNKDGKVDASDLLLFQEQWQTQNESQTTVPG